MSAAHHAGRPSKRRVCAGLLLVLLAVAAVLAYPTVGYLRGSWHWRKARAAIAARDFRAAQEHLDACRSAWPENAEIAFVSARTARQAGDLSTARQNLNDAKRLNWNPDPIQLEDALLGIQTGRDYSPIPDLMRRVREDNPDSVLIIEVLVPVAMRALDFVLAGECLDKWVKIEADKARPHFHRGVLQERLRLKDEALEEFKLAVQYSPDHFEARLRLGHLLLETKQTGEALAQYEWLAQNRPTDPTVRLGLAQCRYELGRKDEAGEIVDAVLREQEKNAVALSLRGRIDMDSGRPADAERWFREALAQAPYEIDLLYNLERSLNAQDKPTEAEPIKRRREAAEADQNDVAKLLLELHKSPTDPEPRRQMAIRMMRNGLEAAAKRWLDVAIQQNPRYAPSYESMADYYERVGNLRAAAEYRSRAKALATEPK